MEIETFVVTLTTEVRIPVEPLAFSMSNNVIPIDFVLSVSANLSTVLTVPVDLYEMEVV